MSKFWGSVHKRGPIGGWFIGGQVSRKAITTEPDHQNQTTKPPGD
ncbi:hypothetical protein ACS9UG_04435 [Yersinia pestis]